MTIDRTYRQEGLTIGRLAQVHRLPEYKLRRLINQGLGYRNFTSLLNHYRLADVKAALGDPSQAASRAFKADTGLTPSEYRRLKLGDAGMAAAVGTGSPIPASVRGIPHSA
jgi:AraC-like DNA-binding protein